MSLRPALFNLWPSPWPEGCKKHAWSYAWGMGGGPLTWHCSICDEFKMAITMNQLPLSGTPNPPRKSPTVSEKPQRAKKARWSPFSDLGGLR